MLHRAFATTLERRRGLAFLMAALGMLVAPPAQAAVYPPDGPLTEVPTPAGIARPGYLAPIIDPPLGTTITRISDPAAFGRPGAGPLRHAYAKNQPWNADESLLMLDYGYPAPLLDGRTYELIGRVHQPSEAIWLNSDPAHMVGVQGNRLVEWDARADRRSAVLHRFGAYSSIELGSGEGNLSNDDRYAALFGFSRRGVDVIVYDIPADRIAERRTFRGASVGDGVRATFNNVAMSQSGDRVVLEYNERGRSTHSGIVSYSRSLRDPVPLSANGGNHYDVCVAADGRESIVAQSDTSDAIVSADLLDGSRTELLPERVMSEAIHISCRNVGRPGWVYLSEFAYGRGRPRATTDALIAVRINNSGTVERFGHEFRSDHSQYVRQAHAVPSRDGSRVLWASDWQQPEGPVLSYVAEQP